MSWRVRRRSAMCIMVAAGSLFLLEEKCNLWRFCFRRHYLNPSWVQHHQCFQRLNFFNSLNMVTKILAHFLCLSLNWEHYSHSLFFSYFSQASWVYVSLSACYCCGCFKCVSFLISFSTQNILCRNHAI